MIKSMGVNQQKIGVKYTIGRVRGLMWAFWKAFWIYQFKALREVYWLMNSDAKVRSQGRQTVGRVEKLETRQHRDSEGDTYETHHVTYRFQTNGDGHTREQKVCSIDRIGVGDTIRVYYMPDRVPVRSAIEPRPKPESGIVNRDRNSAVLKASSQDEPLKEVETRT